MQRSISLPLSATGQGPTDEALIAGFQAAVQLEARILALIHELDVPHILQPFGSVAIDANAMAQRAEARSRKTVQALKERLETLAATHKVALTVQVFRAGSDLAGPRFAELSRVGDLCLIAGMLPQNAVTAEDVVFGCGGPVLLLPDRRVPALLTTSVAIAWDGSRAAARALRDSLSILPPGAELRLITLTHDKPLGEIGTETVAAFLHEHGFKTVQNKGERDDRPVGVQLQELALSHDASLLVMGAYGHQRLYEFILGGATRSVLRDLRLPVLMSH